MQGKPGLIGETVPIGIVIFIAGNAEWYVGKPNSYVSTWLWPKTRNGDGCNRWQSETKTGLP